MNNSNRNKSIHPKKLSLAAIVLLGGAAVLASYAYILVIDPATRDSLWGGVPPGLLPGYTASMVLAAAGYFAFTYFLFFHVDPDRARIAGRFRYSLFHGLYLLILGPSALWLPLTFQAVEQSSRVFAWAARLVLVVVGLASLGLLFALLSLRPRQPLWAYRMAVIGNLFFCIQTVILDAIIWGASFQL